MTTATGNNNNNNNNNNHHHNYHSQQQSTTTTTKKLNTRQFSTESNYINSLADFPNTNSSNNNKNKIESNKITMDKTKPTTIINNNGLANLSKQSTNSTLDAMIDEKFNELAKKILEELREKVYSQDFFAKLDEILLLPKESPLSITSSLLSSSSSSSSSKTSLLKQQNKNKIRNTRLPSNNDNTNTNNRVSSNLSSNSLITNSTLKHHLRYNTSNNSNNSNNSNLTNNCNHDSQIIHQIASNNFDQNQSKSLPVEVIRANDLVATTTTTNNNNNKSSVGPTKIKEQISKLESITGRQNGFVFNENSGRNYAIRKSATTASCDSSRAPSANLNQVSNFPETTIQTTNNNQKRPVLDNNNGNRNVRRKQSIEDQVSKQQRLVEMYKRRIQYRPPDSESDDNDEFDDEDDEEDSRGLFDDYSEEEFNTRRQPQQMGLNHQLDKPGVLKSRTISEITTKQPHQSRHFKASSPKVGSVTRSNTIHDHQNLNNNNNNNNNNHHHHLSTTPYNQGSGAPSRSTCNKLDISSLYKPHMNYSTSVLGNHQLSDDDEIIIIPTQSPSLLSISSNDNMNVQDLAELSNADQSERFSISRTKSFWEKLSKGSKRSSSSNGNHSTSLVSTGTTGTKGSPVNSQNATRNSTLDETLSSQSTLHELGGSKLIGVRVNGHAHGGSPSSSNVLRTSSKVYGTSPGGQEFEGEPLAQVEDHKYLDKPITHMLQHQKLQQLRDDDDMTRQNRFRQTR